MDCPHCGIEMGPTYDPYEYRCGQCGYWYDAWTGKEVTFEDASPVAAPEKAQPLSDYSTKLRVDIPILLNNLRLFASKLRDEHHPMSATFMVQAADIIDWLTEQLTQARSDAQKAEEWLGRANAMLAAHEADRTAQAQRLENITSNHMITRHEALEQVKDVAFMLRDMPELLPPPIVVTKVEGNAAQDGND